MYAIAHAGAPLPAAFQRHRVRGQRETDRGSADWRVVVRSIEQHSVDWIRHVKEIVERDALHLIEQCYVIEKDHLNHGFGHGIPRGPRLVMHDKRDGGWSLSTATGAVAAVSTSSVWERLMLMSVPFDGCAVAWGAAEASPIRPWRLQKLPIRRSV